MDMQLSEYLKELNLAIEAMMNLSGDDAKCVQRVVVENFYRKQSAFDDKIKREIEYSHSEGIG